MANAQQTPERQALDEISMICSEALSHGADGEGVAAIIEAISAKARAPLMNAAKKAVLDDDGSILGVGDTEAEARADALKTIKCCPEVYLRAIVEEMEVRDVSEALADKAMRDGGDVPMKEARVNGKMLLVTPEEAEGAR